MKTNYSSKHKMFQRNSEDFLDDNTLIMSNRFYSFSVGHIMAHWSRQKLYIPLICQKPDINNNIRSNVLSQKHYPAHLFRTY